jgi:hypothetical protein
MSKQNAAHAERELEDKRKKSDEGVAMRKYVLNQKAYSSWYRNDSQFVRELSRFLTPVGIKLYFAALSCHEAIKEGTFCEGRDFSQLALPAPHVLYETASHT